MKFEAFESVLETAFPEITTLQTEQFRAMESLYMEWNSRINVISRKDIEELYGHHVLHSLAIAGFIKKRYPEEYVRMRSGCGKTKILDLGTGGGFPGIPLAILFPEADFTLCDSVGKKLTVAGSITESLGLKNTVTVRSRAEELEERFDYIISRAVASLDKFMPWVKGKYDKGILYLKGGDVPREIAEAAGKNRLDIKCVETWRLDNWSDDPYFEEKFVIFIKNLLHFK